MFFKENISGCFLHIMDFNAYQLNTFYQFFEGPRVETCRHWELETRLRLEYGTQDSTRTRTLGTRDSTRTRTLVMVTRLGLDSDSSLVTRTWTRTRTLGLETRLGLDSW